jgi:hypothetical protein
MEELVKAYSMLWVIFKVAADHLEGALEDSIKDSRDLVVE